MQFNWMVRVKWDTKWVRQINTRILFLYNIRSSYKTNKYIFSALQVDTVSEAGLSVEYANLNAASV